MSLPCLFIKLFFFFIFHFVLSTETIPEIKDLNENNIQSILNSNENFLVLFFVENCSKCNIMNDFFVELSKETKKLGLPLNLLRLNVNENPDLASNFHFTDAPNIMLVLGKYKIFYNYNEDSDIKEMLDFLKR
jgi:thioredoxin-like negative regulator of GroEL